MRFIYVYRKPFMTNKGRKLVRRLPAANARLIVKGFQDPRLT